MILCAHCRGAIKYSGKTYCSNKCHKQYQYDAYIRAWKLGIVEGGRGINTKNISGYVKSYLAKKYSDGCEICGWNKINSITGKIPLEVDHIDGNSENNKEKNLRLICPNCHSLTANFRNLNKGNGRSWRRDKYVKVGR